MINSDVQIGIWKVDSFGHMFSGFTKDIDKLAKCFGESFMLAEKSYKYYNEFMWNKRYAECISVDETIKRMK